MSEQNVEIVRRFMDAMRRFFEAYWENPRSIAAAVEADDLWPEYREMLTYAHPEVEWKTVFLGETHRGYLGTAKVWDDYLKWAEDYRVDLQEVADLGNDRVYATLTLVGKAKAGGAPIDARMFDVFTLREGQIVRLEEYTDRGQALEAARLMSSTP
jgi:ketosteroid isomerase-like protein